MFRHFYDSYTSLFSILFLERKHSSISHESNVGRQISHSAANMSERIGTQSTLAAELIKETPTPVGTPNSIKSASSGVNLPSSLNSIACETPQQKVPTLSCNLSQLCEMAVNT